MDPFSWVFRSCTSSSCDLPAVFGRQESICVKSKGAAYHGAVRAARQLIPPALPPSPLPSIPDPHARSYLPWQLPVTSYNSAMQLESRETAMYCGWQRWGSGWRDWLALLPLLPATPPSPVACPPVPLLQFSEAICPFCTNNMASGPPLYVKVWVSEAPHGSHLHHWHWRDSTVLVSFLDLIYKSSLSW